MNRRAILLVLLVAVGAITLPGVRYLQAQIGRIRVENSYYRIRVVNELGEWARVGMIGYDRDANLRVELRQGTSWTGNLYAGERVVVAWDRHRNLIFASEVEIDRSGTVRLRPMLAYQAPDGRRPGAMGPAERSSPLPRIGIEP
jgi:hypothetical protein